MRKIIYLLSLSLLLGLILNSCQKDDSSEPKEKKLIPIKITRYEDNVVDGETVYEYNINNNLIKVDDGGGYYLTLEYDLDGKITKTKTYEEDTLSSYETYEYNTSNQLIKLQSYNSSGKAGSWYIHEYDTNGNVIKKTQYGTGGAIVLYYTFSYDLNGNMISQKYYWADYPSGVVNTDKYEEWTYTYDDKNNIYKSAGTPFLWRTFINNPLVTTYAEHYGDNTSRTYTNTYIYNVDNYPTEYNDGNERYVIDYKEI